MTVTSNIVIGVAAWQSSHAYTVGVGSTVTLVTNGGNAYLCVQSGTSAASGGPTTSVNGIVDGSVLWNFVCAVSYTSLTSWASGIPGTLTQPIVGQVLAGGPISIPSSASPYLSLSGHTTSPTNTIILTPLAGFGINTDIITGNQAAALSTTTAVCFVAPVTNAFTNSALAGAAAGSPGTLWTGADATTQANGLSFQITATGVDAITGNPTVDLRMHGTGNGSDCNIYLAGLGASVTATLPSTTYTASVGLAIVGGSTANIAGIAITSNDLDSGKGFIQGAGFQAVTLTGTVQAFSTSFTTTAATAFNTFGIDLEAPTNGQPIDITIRIQNPQILQAGPAVNYFAITDANVIFDGIQFQDPNPASGCSLVSSLTGAANFTVRNCIFDGYAQPSGAWLVEFNGQANFYNNLVVDRQPAVAANPTTAIITGNGARIVNNTIVKVYGESGGTTVATNWTTTTGAIFRNNAVYGYNAPFGSGTGGSASADHNVVSASTIAASGLTDAGGNVVSTTAANQFVNPATDFRLKVGAACIKAGVADTTDIPSATDLAGRPRLQWDAGALSFYLSSAGPASISPTKATALATNSLSGFNGASTQNDGFSPGFSLFGPEVGGASFATVAAVATGLLSNVATSASAVTVRLAGVAVQQDKATATTSLSNSISATATLNDSASLALQLPALTPVILVTFPINASGAPIVPPLVCIGAMLQNYTSGACVVLATFSTITGSATLSSFTNSSETNNIDIGGLWRAGQSDQTSATVSFAAVAVSAVANQFDQASVTVSIITMQAVGTISTSASATVALLPLVAIGVATGLGSCVCLATLKLLSTIGTVNRLLQSDPGSISLEADTTNLMLRADLARAPNLTQQATASAAVSLPSMACVASLGRQEVVTAVISIGNLVCVGQTTLQDLANSTAVVASLAAVGVMAQSTLAYAGRSYSTAWSVDYGPPPAITFYTFICNATGMSATTAVGSATISLMSAVAQAATVDLAQATGTVVLSATSSMSSSTSASSRSSIPPVVAVGLAGGSDGASASSSALSLTAFSVPTLFAATVATKAGLACTATMGSFTACSAITPLLTLTAVATETSNTIASGAVMLVRQSAVASLTQAGLMFAVESLPSLIPLGTLVQQNQASSTSSIPALSAIATAMVNIQASAALLIEPLIALGFISDAAFGGGTIPQQVCIALLTQQYAQGSAFCLANLEVLAAIGSMTSLTTANERASISLTANAAVGQSDGCTAPNTIPPLVAVCTAVQQDQATTTRNINLAASGVAMVNIQGATVSTIETLSCVGFLNDASQALGSINLSCVGLLNQNYPAGISFCLANIGVVTGAATMASATMATAADIITVGAAAAISSQSFASGVSALPPVVCSGVAGKSELVTATVSLPPMTAQAGIGSGGASSIFITVSATAAVGISASAVIGIGALAETSGKLYTSPTVYETGQEVIYWPA